MYQGQPTDNANYSFHYDNEYKPSRLEIHFSPTKCPTDGEIFCVFQAILRTFIPESDFYQFSPEYGIIAPSLVGWQSSWMAVFGSGELKNWPELNKIPGLARKLMTTSIKMLPVSKSWWLKQPEQ